MLIPREVLDIHRIASKDEERPNLTGVHAEREREHPRLTATDGHRLLTVTWNEPKADDPPADFGDLSIVPGFTAEIPAETCAELKRAIPCGEIGEVFRHAWVEETTANGVVRSGAGDKALGQAIQIETKRPELEFPYWRAVTHVKGAVRIGVNGKLLAELLKTIGAITGEKGVVLHIPTDPTQAIGLHADRVDGTLHVDAVLMPMRLDLTGRPDWEDVPVLPNTPDKVPKAPAEATADANDEPSNTRSANEDRRNKDCMTRPPRTTRVHNASRDSQSWAALGGSGASGGDEVIARPLVMLLPEQDLVRGLKDGEAPAENPGPSGSPSSAS